MNSNTYNKDNLSGQEQFGLSQKDHLQGVDFINWYRFFFIIKEIIARESERVLEIGEGSGVIRRAVEPIVDKYKTMDVNRNLTPDFLSDVRVPVPDIARQFDCVVAADILEHIPFSDLEAALRNIRSYLNQDGVALITIPHRASYFLWMTPTYISHIIRIPTGFLSWGSFYRRFIKRKIWIDPDHQWEIGDGTHKIKDVEEVMQKAGFVIEKRKKLLYVDFWILKK